MFGICVVFPHLFPQFLVYWRVWEHFTIVCNSRASAINIHELSSIVTYRLMAKIILRTIFGTRYRHMDSIFITETLNHPIRCFKSWYLEVLLLGKCKYLGPIYLVIVLQTRNNTTDSIASNYKYIRSQNLRCNVFEVVKSNGYLFLCRQNSLILEYYIWGDINTDFIDLTFLKRNTKAP